VGNGNRGWVLEAYPIGDDFESALTLRDLPKPEPGAGQVLVRSLYISLDPANRGWMMMPTYIPQVPLGATMWGFVLGRVERSNAPGFAPRDLVSGFGAWAEYCLVDAATVGIAGSPEKCAWLTGELGFDHAIDYQREDVGARLGELCPQGVDIYFDNVGGPLANAVAGRIALRGRIVLCGSMAKFSNPGPDLDLGPILLNRATIQGFILIDHFERLPAANAQLAAWHHEGRLKHKADIVDGLENAVAAFRMLFTPGAPHMGKLLVRIDPAAD
jgi:NADPH-dependent curcumin reductase CurA